MTTMTTCDEDAAARDDFERRVHALVRRAVWETETMKTTRRRNKKSRTADDDDDDDDDDVDDDVETTRRRDGDDGRKKRTFETSSARAHLVRNAIASSAERGAMERWRLMEERDADADDGRDKEAEDDATGARVFEAIRSVRQAMRDAFEDAKSRREDDLKMRETLRALLESLEGLLDEIVEDAMNSRPGGCVESTRRSRGEARRREVVREAARSAWAILPAVGELEVQEKYNASEEACRGLFEDTGTLVRLLDDFDISAQRPGDAKRRHVKFSEKLFKKQFETNIRVSGKLRSCSHDALAVDGDAETCDIQLDDVVGFHYIFTTEHVKHRGFYIATPHAWYKLLRPKIAYAALYDRSIQMRFDLALRAARALQTNAKVSYDAVLPNLLTREPSIHALQCPRECDEAGESWAVYQERDVWLCKETLLYLCDCETSHLSRRAASLVATLTKKYMSQDDLMRDRREEFVLCHASEVADPDVSDLNLVFGPCLSKACADTPLRVGGDAHPPPLTIPGEIMESLSESFKDADDCVNHDIVEEAVIIWQFCMQHADFLRLPRFTMKRFVQALVASHVSVTSLAVLRDVNCALIAAIEPQCSMMALIVTETSSRTEESGDDSFNGIDVRRRKSLGDVPISVHAWPDIAANLVDGADVSDVSLAAIRAAALLRRVDFFQLTLRMRIATLSALVTLTLKSPEFHKYVQNSRAQAIDRDGNKVLDTSTQQLLALDDECRNLDGYEDLIEGDIEDHPIVARTKLDLMLILNSSSHHWNRAGLREPIFALVTQCKNASLIELRLVLWNVEVAYYRIGLLNRRAWSACRQLWRTKLCAARTPAQVASLAYVLSINL